MSRLLPRVRHGVLRRFLFASTVRFARSTRGGATAITATVLAVMLLGGTALVSDHLWMVGQRDMLRGAADAASFAAVQEMKTLPADWSDDEVETHLLALAERYAYYNVIGNAPVTLDEDDITVTVTVKRSEGAVAVRVDADTGGTLLSRYLYGVTGPAEMTAQGGSEVRTKAVEVVLAIDTSYSMSHMASAGETRLAVVKRAAEAMLDTIDVGNGPVAMGIVPWERTVRLDDTLRTAWTSDGYVELPSTRTYRAPWSGTKSAANALTQTLPDSAPETWRGCLDQRALDSTVDGVPLGISSAVPTSSEPIPQWLYPPSEYGVAYSCEDIKHSDYEFMYCYDSASATLDTHGTRSDLQDSCTNAFPVMTPLSADASAVRTQIRSLTHSYDEGRRTYSALGVAWATRMLDPDWRSLWGGDTHPVDPNDRAYLEVRKVLVLLTDGRDTIGEASWLGLSESKVSELILGRSLSSLQATACQAAKDDGIEVYVIGAIAESSISQTMRDAFVACSSAPDSDSADDYVFLGAVDKDDIEEAFSAISERVSSLRRTH